MITLLAQPFGFTDAIAAKLLSSGTTEETEAVDTPPLTTTDLERAKPLPPAEVHEATLPVATTDEDVLWLARCIYSETKRPDEQELVAWVVRNRVDTRYRGKRTYKDVVLDPYQFSAFNPGTRTRSRYLALSPASKSKGWSSALRIAREVATAPPVERPFPEMTRHFYSERSMPQSKMPTWAELHQPVPLERPIDPRRFRFYNTVR